MVEKPGPFGCILLGFWFALLCLFGEVVHGLFAGYWISFATDRTPIQNFAVFLFVGVVLFSSASPWIDRAGPLNRILIACWLALLLVYGLQGVQHTISWYSGERFGNSGWLGYVVAVALISSIPLLALTN